MKLPLALCALSFFSVHASEYELDFADHGMRSAFCGTQEIAVGSAPYEVVLNYDVDGIKKEINSENINSKIKGLSAYESCRLISMHLCNTCDIIESDFTTKCGNKIILPSAVIAVTKALLEISIAKTSSFPAVDMHTDDSALGMSPYSFVRGLTNKYSVEYIFPLGDTECYSYMRGNKSQQDTVQKIQELFGEAHTKQLAAQDEATQKGWDEMSFGSNGYFGIQLASNEYCLIQ